MELGIVIMFSWKGSLVGMTQKKRQAIARDIVILCQVQRKVLKRFISEYLLACFTSKMYNSHSRKPCSTS